MALAEKTAVATDPVNSMKVRFTDNSAKEGDYYPEDQVPKPLFLDPNGAPYTQWEELGGYEIGQDERTDSEARDDHEAWAIQEKFNNVEKGEEHANS